MDIASDSEFHLSYVFRLISQKHSNIHTIAFRTAISAIPKKSRYANGRNTLEDICRWQNLTAMDSPENIQTCGEQYDTRVDGLCS